jgi:uncharacterized membrane protein
MGVYLLEMEEAAIGEKRWTVSQSLDSVQLELALNVVVRKSSTAAF